ncbi:hypothetical protein JCM10512_841 [Bacteroides reticulotermitis JCM 10512]|uniref:Alpha-1,2-fucosyltransferase n=1 Tax=Bacteroides reticulotermitis JCM 10512 TaxID=1445607 RepID=W4UNU7_9BACE|nr:hypothetical protein JCM10512_841 [Bacteroides reticulotermitis JCM 10512]
MRTIKRWKRSLYKKLVKYKVIAPKVIVLMDGGICSQMFQYLIGRIFEEKGYKVVFDLTFYKEWGSDMNNHFVRNFDLLKAFPNLKMEIASDLMITVYKQKYFNLGNNTYGKVDDFSFLQRKPPIYLGGYYHLPSRIWLPTFKSIFKILASGFDDSNQRMCSEIGQRHASVAVHVRRGDLKNEIPAYGKPASVEYFRLAISYLFENVESPFFYFSQMNRNGYVLI